VAFDRIRVLIWGKTYPELSDKYVETVCTGAVREDGSPVRLFPVPLRYLDTAKQYELYDWIEVPVEKSTRDPRPESYKVDPQRIVRVGHINPDGKNWSARRAAVFKDPRWQFGSVQALKAEQQTSNRSMGIVTPGEIVRVSVEYKKPEEEAQFEQKWADIEAQRDMFHPQYKSLQYLPYKIRLEWRCAEPCNECGKKPHYMGVLDWGLLELARRMNDPEKAADRLRAITDPQHDFKVFMGTFFRHPQVFGVIGLWYPKLNPQGELDLGGD
jgi:hypothetical protein